MSICIDAEVAERMDLLCRVSRVTRHELGNLLYPGSKLLDRVAAGGGDGERLSETARLMMSLVDEVRRGLDLVQPVDRVRGDGPCVLSEVWRSVSAYGRSLLPEGAAVRMVGVDETVEINACACGVAMVLLTACAAVERLAAEGSEIALSISGSAEHGGVVRVSAEGAWRGEPAAPGLLAAYVEACGGTLSDRVDGDRWEMEVRWPGNPGTPARHDVADSVRS